MVADTDEQLVSRFGRRAEESQCLCIRRSALCGPLKRNVLIRVVQLGEDHLRLLVWEDAEYMTTASETIRGLDNRLLQQVPTARRSGVATDAAAARPPGRDSSNLTH